MFDPFPLFDETVRHKELCNIASSFKYVQRSPANSLLYVQYKYSEDNLDETKINYLLIENLNSNIYLVLSVLFVFSFMKILAQLRFFNA